jgi:hypothetical protein
MGSNLQDTIADVINEVMAYKPSDVLPNMDDHVFNNEDDDGCADNKERQKVEFSGQK